jgi:hypothetical protein
MRRESRGHFSRSATASVTRRGRDADATSTLAQPLTPNQYGSTTEGAEPSTPDKAMTPRPSEAPEDDTKAFCKVGRESAAPPSRQIKKRASHPKELVGMPRGDARSLSRAK